METCRPRRRSPSWSLTSFLASHEELKKIHRMHVLFHPCNSYGSLTWKLHCPVSPMLLPSKIHPPDMSIIIASCHSTHQFKHLLRNAIHCIHPPRKPIVSTAGVIPVLSCHSEYSAANNLSDIDHFRELKLGVNVRNLCCSSP